MLNFGNLPQITGGKLIQCEEDRPVTDLLTDSRRIIVTPGAVFFASKGKRHDGHVFIKELYLKGIRQFVLEVLPKKLNEFDKANFLLVTNSLHALQEIAANHRRLFEIPVIAITGSNGKTIVKEWLSQALAQSFRVVKSPKSYNSQLGVPLSVWQMNTKHEIGVFEAGISEYGEMERLERIIKPDIGIFTNLGTAHDQNFRSTHDKLAEKIKLFDNCKSIIYCTDHELVEQALQRNVRDKSRLIGWSKSNTGAAQLKQLSKNENETIVELVYEETSSIINIPFIDEASLENCFHCICCLLILDFSLDNIQKAINSLSNISMRLELKQGVNGCYIVDDSYNNDVAGLEIALDFLLQQKQKNKHSLILSDILQTGLSESVLFPKIASLIQQKQIDKFIGIGEAFMRNQTYFPPSSTFYPDTDSFIKSYPRHSFQNEIILIKGARPFHFEKIVNVLEYKHHGTVLEVDLNALVDNLNFYKSKLAPQTRIMVMVKAFAYGSGSYEIANLLQYHRVDYLAVAYSDEGVRLRENGITIPIMVMNPSPDSYEKLVQYNLEPEIFSLNSLNGFLLFLKSSGQTSRIHLKLDTGMHRLGFEEEDLQEALSVLKDSRLVELASIFTHLAGADEDVHFEFSKAQVEEFKKLSSLIEQELQVTPIKHILNSAGIIRYPQYQFDMVRLGIGLYGLEVNNRFQNELQPISTLKTTISQIKHIKKGSTIGYSRKGVAAKDTKIATIAIGYADGFSRNFSNGNAKLLVNGKMAPVIGNVCMDMTMIDITGINAKEGDEVIVFGKELPIYVQSQNLQAFPYELLTNISERVKRVFYAE